jgi:hypothetical protein
MRRSKNKQSKSKTKQRQGVRVGPTGKPILSVPFSVPSFYLTQASSGNGGFTTAVSGASLTASNGFPIDPFNIGGNVYQMAALYTFYRLRQMRITYVPFTAANGMVPTVTGSTASPTYAGRVFALHVVLDPSLTNTNFASILASSGAVRNTTRGFSYSVRGGLFSQWRYCSTTGSSPSTIDMRQACPGKCEMAYSDTSTTGTQTYGLFMLSGTADYEGVLDRSIPVGLSASFQTPVLSLKTSSKDDEKSENKTKEPPKPSWFS